MASNATVTVDYFETLSAPDGPPADVGPALSALWWMHRNAWDKAHIIVQDEVGRDAAWVHALLHRVEGDHGNAAYWYLRAERPFGTGSPEDEWRAIATALFAERQGHEA